MLKMEVTEVPTGLETYYKQEGDKFVLQVDGAVPKTQYDAINLKVKEFRESNDTLKARMEELGGLELVADAKAGVKVKDTIEQLVQTRVGSMKSKFEQDLTAEKQAKSKYFTRLADALLNDAVKTASMSHGVAAVAVDDVLGRVRSMFKVDEVDGDLKVVPAVEGGDEHGNPWTIDTYVASMKTKAPHLFQPSQGTGTFNRSRGQSPTKPEASRSQRLAGFFKKP
jgi:hypothetical protein